MRIKAFLSILLLFSAFIIYGQEDMLKLVGTDSVKKQNVSMAFKSSRVINGHSMEMLGKGVFDFRILHRFGAVNTGAKNLFGLDQANMRFGFDYGLGKNLTIGFGRSNVSKEFDGFIKYRPVWQSRGPGGSPVSVVLIAGSTLTTQAFTNTNRKNFFSSRMSYYSEIIIGRKFSQRFSMQLSPTMVHRNLVPLETDDNDVYALGIGGRLKLSKRMALVADYHYIMTGLDKDVYSNPLSVGIDIETGGHVFQLHFSNSLGMNEKAFITNTTDKWSKGDIRFGFNLSRVFQLGGHKKAKAY